MPAIIDLYAKTLALPPRERIIGIAQLYVGTPYGYGDQGRAADRRSAWGRQAA